MEYTNKICYTLIEDTVFKSFAKLDLILFADNISQKLNYCRPILSLCISHWIIPSRILDCEVGSPLH